VSFQGARKPQSQCAVVVYSLCICSFSDCVTMSVARVLSQIRPTAEKLLSPKLLCSWNDAYPFRRGLKLSAASVGNELNVGSQIRRCLSARTECTKHESLNSTRRRTGRQCNFSRTAVVCSHRRVPVIKRATAFCTDCIFCKMLSDTLYSSELQ